MKALLLVIGLAAVAMAMTTTVKTTTENNSQTNLVTINIRDKQLFIMKLLNHVTQPIMYKEIQDIGMNFKIEDNVDMYTKTDIVKDFVNTIKSGVLPRGEIFTLHVDRQLKEVVQMFHVLFYAEDFQAFIKTASWMRLYMNEGMFVYALTVAIRQREDCKGIILPPPYEIYPYYFLRADVIQKAYLMKMKKGLLDPKLNEFYGIKQTEKGIIIDENVYDKRVYLNDEDRLRYFTEDIDLNTYYYYFHVDYPFWMKDALFDKLKTRRFEMTVYMYQQILARYYLERLSSGLGNIPTLSWNKPIKNGYWPWIQLHNGVQIPMRLNDQYIVQDNDVSVITMVEAYETIIKEAIIKGYIEINGMVLQLTKPEDIETLGKMIYGKMEKTENNMKRVDAYRYLLIIMKSVLGLNTMTSDKYFVVPSILDSYQTALRDPVFYQLQKRLIDMVLLFKKRLPSYTREELYFPGVKIDNIVVDKLITYFDDYLMDMTNVVTLTEDEMKKNHSDIIFMARKRRLNHQPFRINIDVVSDKNVDSVVRLFLGPKRDHLDRILDINTNRVNFVELDSFVYKLNMGKNNIVRNSIDMHNLVRDRMSTHALMKKMESKEMNEQLFKEFKNFNTGFPARLLLPKGTVGGLEMMIYCIVTPLNLVNNDLNIFDQNRPNLLVDFRSTVLLDKMPLGFPLDRHIDVSKFFTPNMKFLDVTIYHKRQTSDMKTRFEKYVLMNYSNMPATDILSSTQRLISLTLT